MALFDLGRLPRPAVALLRATIAAAGPRVPLALVGGIVRDIRLRRRDRLPRGLDLDVAAERDALGIARRVAARVGGALVPLDPERGAARVLAAGIRLDLADFRAPTLEEDLAARDWTVNALAVPLRELLARGRAPIVDPTGGLADLRARRLRPAGPGVLAEDPLRALRGVRLAEALGFRLTPAAVRAIRDVAPAVARVSAERVRDEVFAMLGLPAAARALRALDRLGLLAVALPEVEPMRGTRQPPPHRFSVLEHCLRSVAAADHLVARAHRLAPFGEELARHLAEPIAGGITRAQVLKLAALLHDVAKPETRSAVGERIHFYAHDLRGAVRVRAIGGRLRLPERVVAVLERLTRHHLRVMHLGSAGEVTPRARYRFFRDLGQEARDLLLLVIVDAAAVRGESPFVVWRRAPLVRDLLRGWAEQQAAAEAPPLVRGQDVMERFGLGPGPEVGRLLARAREAQVLGLVTTREEVLRFLDSPGAGP